MKATKREITVPSCWGSERSDHHFRVVIPRTKAGDVVITENFIAADPDLSPVIGDDVKPRVILPKARWNHIAAAVRVEFNGRSKKAGFGAGAWQIGANELPRAFGKELVLLAWAIEQAPEEKIPCAIQNWLGLSPEERWWLYTQANAATGHAEKGRGKGWRKAIQIALTENPVSVSDKESTKNDPAVRSAGARSTAELKKSLTI